MTYLNESRLLEINCKTSGINMLSRGVKIKNYDIEQLFKK